MKNVLTRHECCKVQPAPAMQTGTAEQAQRTVGLMFSMRPQFSSANREFGIRRRILGGIHAAILGSFSEGL